jgi:hypothetical protein
MKPSDAARPIRVAKRIPPVETSTPLAPKPTAPKPTALKPIAPVAAKTVIAKPEAPTLIAKAPVETPMAEVIPALRPTRPPVPSARPAVLENAKPIAASPAPAIVPAVSVSTVRPAPAAKASVPASVASPHIRKPAALKPAVRMARAETRSPVELGHARAEEFTPNPASARTLLARPPLRLMMGQEMINFDVQPTIQQGVAIAPLRQIFEHTGGVVMWLPAERTVQATTGSRHIEVQIGSRRALINNEATLMERPATLKSGRTMVPVRFLQAALDMKAVYDPSKGLVYLYRK